ncbi:GntR family transcriptional regulator [Nonomuraea typhae]|uniref:GntR family transcriptional regulator n=1 Tax=Nonomuraea typhae TaxID=2603600 RepID=UPI0012FCC42E|nr:GntR family transcriptional regulator [Nonomuraea typhae]
MARSVAQEIADDLRDEIQSGRLAPGGLLPSERELIARYKVSKTTVAKALAQLRAEGLLVSEVGRGVFVRSVQRLRRYGTKRHLRSGRPEGTAPLEAEAQAQGMVRERHLLEVATIPAPREIAELLGADEGAALVVRRHVLTINGEPAQIADSYFLASQVTGTIIAQLEQISGGVHGELAELLGHPQMRAVEDLIARMPTPSEAETLTLPPGTPVVELTRTIYADERPVEVTKFLFDGSRHIFTYDVPMD